MSDALHWLSLRTPAAPAALYVRMTAALRAAETRLGVAAGPAASLPTLLAEAGLDQLRRTLAESTEDAALELLAADALLTYACEAAAELGGDALARLQDALAPARFAALLDEPGA